MVRGTQEGGKGGPGRDKKKNVRIRKKNNARKNEFRGEDNQSKVEEHAETGEAFERKQRN